MGRLSEYDHVEREALRKGISRQPDPLPRGAVVAGEHVCRTERIVPTGDGFAKCLDCGDDTFPWDSEDGEPAVEGKLEVVGWRSRYTHRLWHPDAAEPPDLIEWEPFSLTLPAQERISTLEARPEQEVVERRLKESALARVGELEDAVAEMGARLERVRGVVGAAVKMAQETDFAIPGDKEAWKSILDVEKFVDALTPEDREWAEGEET